MPMLGLTLLLQLAPAIAADGPSTDLRSEYVMTVMIPLEAPLAIDDALQIYSVKPTGGWVRGPRITGTFVGPGADWSRVMPGGIVRIDVRLTIKTDDGALIFMTYNGVIQSSPQSDQKMQKGEILSARDIPYFMTAPTFETGAPRYAWLNAIQAVGKMVEYKDGAGGFVKYDLFAMR